MKNLVCFIRCAFVILLLQSSSFAQDGQLDLTFNNGEGYKIMNVYDEKNAFPNDLDIYPDGRLLLACATNTAGFSEAVLFRMLPDGNFDHSFNGTGKLILPYPNAGISATAAVILPNEKIVMVSSLYNYGKTDSIALFRFNSDGTPDNTFDGDGVAIASFGFDIHSISTMVLQDDGKLVMAGYVGNSTDTFDLFFIARFLANGLPDPTFDSDGYAVAHYGDSWTYVSDLAIQPDGKYVAAGYSTTAEQEDMIVLRFTTQGTLDNSFSGDGKAPIPFSPTYNDNATSISVLPDGKILIGGWASINDGGQGFAVARLTANGIPDPDFHGDGMNIVQASPYAERNSAMLIQPDGKVILGGSSNPQNNSHSVITLVRLLPTGVPDASFDEDGIATTSLDAEEGEGEIDKLAFTPDGKLMILGSSFYYNRSLLTARYTTGITVSSHDAEPIIEEINVFPNPVHDQFSMQFHLLAPARIEVTLTDTQGRILEQLMTPSSVLAGNHSETFQLRTTPPPGHYFINLHAGMQSKTIGISVH